MMNQQEPRPNFNIKPLGFKTKVKIGAGVGLVGIVLMNDEEGCVFATLGNLADFLTQLILQGLGSFTP